MFQKEENQIKRDIEIENYLLNVKFVFWGSIFFGVGEWGGLSLSPDVSRWFWWV